MLHRKRTVAVRAALSVALLVVYAAVFYKVYAATWARPHMLVYRIVFITIFFAFLGLHIYLPIRKLYDFIFRHRFLLTAIAFVLLVAAKINLSNISVWNYFVQPGEGSDFLGPIFGTSRAIRSDEWAVSLPRTLSYQFCAGEKYNDIIMGTLTPNLSTSHLYPSLSALATPFYWGYYFLGMEYGLSFYWCGIILFTLLASNEFFLIISGRKKLLSFMGAAALTFSPFFLWWSSVQELSYGLGAVVFIWYFLHNTKTYQRILCGLGVAVFGSAFVCTLYPAWLVPFGYIWLSIIIWSFVKNFSNIKAFRVWDWVIFGLTVVLALAVVAMYLYNQIDYITAISNTVYPGHREVTGGFTLLDLFRYPASSKFGWAENGINTTEFSSVFSFYPLPTVLALYVMIRARRKDLLMILLLCVSAVFTVYCTVGLPYIVAKVTLMTYSMPARVAPVLGVMQILLLARAVSVMQDEDCFICKIPAAIGAVVLGVVTMYFCGRIFPNYIGIKFGAMTFAVIVFCAYGFMAKCHPRVRQGALAVFIAFEIATGLLVLPIQRGTDAIYSKPLAQAVSAIVEEDPDAKWIALDSWMVANFCAACGAPTINSNNYMPNFQLWQTLFDQETYESYNEIYNRYAHLNVELTEAETSLELQYTDQIKLNLNYNDLDKADIGYVVSEYSLDDVDSSKYSFQEIYSEAGIYIYKVVY